MKATLASIIMSTLFFIASYFILYLLFDYFNPPITEDGHKYMPIGNVFYSGITAFTATILFFIIIRKYIKRKL
ncbi:hypothetical protein SAMN05443633_102455 [Chryseobacterium arachidis]|uniref:Uncharacterized protein n=2 Tax=Chryseobacterium arachidis TaxID=1416778 RepID=A0A1M4XXX0_9FLAO|nr:hypothetical protein SAMN05443633_102455 [Chryseobacterium arachidis]